MLLNKDFKEFIELLNRNNVKYLVVGGYALAFHGHPRYTKNIDLWIWINKENAENVIKALHDFGFNSLDIKIEDFLKPNYVIQLGNPPNRIDLLTSLSGVDFGSCYSSKMELNIENTLVNFINLDNLKKNKKASGRLQDLADLENLK